MVLKLCDLIRKPNLIVLLHRRRFGMKLLVLYINIILWDFDFWLETCNVFLCWLFHHIQEVKHFYCSLVISFGRVCVLEKCKIMDSYLVFWGKTIGWAQKVISEELSSNACLLFDLTLVYLTTSILAQQPKPKLVSHVV